MEIAVPVALSIGAVTLMSAMAGMGKFLIDLHNEKQQRKKEDLAKLQLIDKCKMSETEKRRHAKNVETIRQRTIQEREIEFQRQAAIALAKEMEAKKERIAKYLRANPKDFAYFSKQKIDNVHKGALKWMTVYGAHVFEHTNIAFVGQVKKGKSSLINALRNLKDDEPDAAKVGVIEVKTTLVRFTWNLGARVLRLWDTPGCGTHSVPAADFHFNDQLILFDHIILVTDHGICENEAHTIQYCEENKVPYSVVCTKLDEKLRSAEIKEESEHPTQPSYRRVLNTVRSWLNPSTLEPRALAQPRKTSAEIKSDLLNELKKGYKGVPENKLFFVSAPSCRQYMGQTGKINYDTNTPQSIFDEAKLLHHIGSSITQRYGIY